MPNRLILSLLFLCILHLQGNATKKQYLPPTRLEVIGKIPIPIGPAAFGVALTDGPGGEWYVLLDGYPRIIRWDANERVISDIELSGGGWSKNMNISPKDFTVAAGLDLLVIDPYNPVIVRYNRRLELLNPVKPNIGEHRFEPLSICSAPDGTLYVINQADKDIWRIQHNGIATPLGGASSRGGWLINPIQVRFCSKLQKLVLLDDENIQLCDLFGNPGVRIPIEMSKPRSLTVHNGEVWIVGDALECMSLQNRRQELYLPSDSLYNWNVYPPAAVMLPNNNLLYMLPGSSDQILKLKIIRIDSSE